MGLKWKIDSKREWLELFCTLWQAGLLEDVSVEDINLSEDCFPIEAPVEIDKLIELLRNPLVKPYKRKIETSLRTNLAKVLG